MFCLLIALTGQNSAFSLSFTEYNLGIIAQRAVQIFSSWPAAM